MKAIEKPNEQIDRLNKQITRLRASMKAKDNRNKEYIRKLCEAQKKDMLDLRDTLLCKCKEKDALIKYLENKLGI